MSRPATRGELVVRGPQVFSGYYGKPEETEKVFVDGWFRTGDIVTVDEAGFVRIVDRIKELIITGGFNVAPTEVEIALRQHPQVEDAAVVGLPSAQSGEEVVAAIVRRPGCRHRHRGDPRVRPRHPDPVQGSAAHLRRRRAAEVAHRQGAAPPGARLAAAADDRRLTPAALELSRRDRRVRRRRRTGYSVALMTPAATAGSVSMTARAEASSGASKIVMPNVPSSSCVRPARIRMPARLQRDAGSRSARRRPRTLHRSRAATISGRVGTMR